MQGGSAVRAGETIDPAELLFLEAIERPAGERESWIASRTDVERAMSAAARSADPSRDVARAMSALNNLGVVRIDRGDLDGAR
ncbi:MAG: hypothetical protein ACKORL_11465, partial [Phycisphaerales bacterium]